MWAAWSQCWFWRACWVPGWEWSTPTERWQHAGFLLNIDCWEGSVLCGGARGVNYELQSEGMLRLLLSSFWNIFGTPPLWPSSSSAGGAHLALLLRLPSLWHLQHIHNQPLLHMLVACLRVCCLLAYLYIWPDSVVFPGNLTASCFCFEWQCYCYSIINRNKFLCFS